MKKRNTSKGGRAKVWLAVLACMTVLVCGFFFAARQHFSSMDFGMKNSRLRKQIDDLESEKRRLLLAREVSLSAIELRKAAARAKLSVSDAVTPELASATAAVKDKVIQPVTAAFNGQRSTSGSNPMIQKTVATAATNIKPMVASVQKSAVERPRTVDKKVARVTSAAE